ncbi:MAG: PilT domain-containing protein [bacterium]|nr:MAG: PilT domain-containing protein [bacterium]KAF0150204.1 MAG: PilT domain-containing protein [bacterium]KAF0169684.1 MAG: PilT domain-containing protein [bacterium]TXT21593.1 MAG: PilT domain-containing protein [bacterium]
MRYMLDTNICIHLIQNHPPEVLDRFRGLRQGDVVISAVTLAELRHGVERAPAVRDLAARALDNLLAYLPVMPFDEAAATRYGVLAALVKDRKRDALDRLIAAHAVSLELILVTNNEVDFKDYPGLTLENWCKPAL